jgi:hypothetical protein
MEAGIDDLEVVARHQ